MLMTCVKHMAREITLSLSIDEPVHGRPRETQPGGEERACECETACVSHAD